MTGAGFVYGMATAGALIATITKVIWTFIKF